MHPPVGYTVTRNICQYVSLVLYFAMRVDWENNQQQDIKNKLGIKFQKSHDIRKKI